MHKVNNIKNNVSDSTKIKELILLNKNIENGHIIRQSMKFNHATIRNWIKPRIKSIPDLHLSISTSKNIFCGLKQKSVIHTLIKWIEETFNPTAFLTIQLPDKLRTENKGKAQEYFRSVMACYERQLLGREWNKYHLPFICFMEKGISRLWHAHILFNQAQFKPWHLWLAVNNTIHKFGWPDYSMHLDIITDRKKAIGYCLKEIKVNTHGHFESNRFLLSDELFGCNTSTHI